MVSISNTSLSYVAAVIIVACLLALLARWQVPRFRSWLERMDRESERRTEEMHRKRKVEK
jgi:cytochrome oxidase assembly protein ShyY1